MNAALPANFTATAKLADLQKRGLELHGKVGYVCTGEIGGNNHSFNCEYPFDPGHEVYEIHAEWTQAEFFQGYDCDCPCRRFSPRDECKHVWYFNRVCDGTITSESRPASSFKE